VTGLARQVMAVLERSILPSVIARGGAIRVASVTDGVLTLEVTGSPGAVLPLASRIQAQIRAAVPAITSVQLITPGTTPAEPAAPAPHGAAALAEAARRILDTQINPAIAAHRGHVAVAGVTDGWVRIRLEGGCQGCSLAEVTIRQGIEPLLRSRAAVAAPFMLAAFAAVALLRLPLPWVLVALGPFTVAHSAFMHANLNWTLGPFKYVIAGPVFHRWHHTAAERGGEKNFASTFPLIDLAFGTFYMPENSLPDAYGIADRSFPPTFGAQMLYPFKQ